MRSMKQFLILLTVFLASASFASSNEEQQDNIRDRKVLTPKEAKCFARAKEIASALLNSGELPSRKVTIESYIEYGESHGDTKKESYFFGDGEAGLLVVMLPNYHNDGKCHFKKAEFWLD